MHVLALDTTTRAGSVAIVSDDRVLLETSGNAQRSHAERLPTDLLTALDACGLSSADIDVFAIASGPGSFTGLRIGIATQQGFAAMHGRHVVAVSALLALAEAAAAELEAGAIVGAWMDAHRREVFSALFRVRGGPPFALDRLSEIEAPAASDPMATLDRWREMNVLPVAIAGDGVVAYGSLLPPGVRRIAPPPLAGIMGRMAVVRAHAGQTVAPGGVQPLYVRRPDAVVAREKLSR
jgi:tRNA threonylcarbamoyladenosine biosynthesis protein TsaB